MVRKTIVALNYKQLSHARQSSDGSWSSDSARIGHRSTALAVDPNQTEHIYVGTDGHGVLKTEDYGASWTPVGLDGQIVRALAISKLRPGTMYAGTKPARLFATHDYGQSWTELPALRQMKRWYWFTPAERPLSAYVMKIALSPTDADVILVGIEAAGLLRSADGGQSWTGHPSGAVRDCHDLTFHPTDGNWAYEGGGGSAAFSRDGGKSWTQPDPLNMPAELIKFLLRRSPDEQAGDGKLDRRYGWAVAADPQEPSVWYFSASTGPSKAHGEGDARAAIYRCRDGRHWERLSGGLPQPLDHFPYALLTDVEAPGQVYAVLQNGDIWHSQDQGNSWTKLGFNLDGVWYRAVLV
ncbi:MAG: hypothetical protein R3300_03520 [Candidatus Promineifilaceae bacterium]|nr:hypothetical protein [Candidatus Promineifilaceae bacterium]